MKKSLSVLLAAFLSLAACQNIEQLVPEVADDVLSAHIEQYEVTKTVLGESNNILWSEDDQIVAFMKTSYGHKYQILSSFAGKTYADFSKTSSGSGDNLSAGMKWDHNVAYYPYAEGIECVKSDVNYTLDVVIPADQTYAENSFGNGYFPMVAVSEDNDITFKNICGGMKLQLKGTQKVTSITVQGKNNELLSGAATVTAYTDGETKPSITLTGTDAASKSVTLDCGAGVQLSESTVTEFIIALPPVVFTEGFVVIITDSEDNEHLVTSDRENEVIRSSLLVMPEVTLESSGADLEIPAGEYVNLSQSGTANSYIVSQKGSYKFSTVKGNSSESVGAVASAEVLWETFGTDVTPNVGDLVKNASYSDGYITFQTADTFKEGNAVIAAKDASGNILWSWHIWLEEDKIIEHFLQNDAGVMMDRNLGATSAQPGDVKGLGLLYQWGRKDPFLAAGSMYNGASPAASTVEWPTPVSTTSNIGTIENSTANPMLFIYSSGYSGDWIYGGNNNPSQPLWNLEKTIYDPCPIGWRVPDGGVEGVWRTAGFSKETAVVNGGGIVFSNSGLDIWYPFASYYDFSNGTYSGGSYGFYWTSTITEYDSRCMQIYTGGTVSVNTYYYRANGASIRCFRDLKYGEPKTGIQDIILNVKSLVMAPGTSFQPEAKYLPENADIIDLTWLSEDMDIATVDDNGCITAVCDGVTNVICRAHSGESESIIVTVKSPDQTHRYVDANGVDQGFGIRINGVVWAPVNCGYNPDDTPEGLLYQWGRKLGQSPYSSSTMNGPVSLYTATMNNKVITVKKSPYDWSNVQIDYLWNKGTEENPIKTYFDPCPTGWRVPTYLELENLMSNVSQHGNRYIASGEYSNIEGAPVISLPIQAGASQSGLYWSSEPWKERGASSLRLHNDEVYKLNWERNSRMFVRCVVSDNEPSEVPLLNIEFKVNRYEIYTNDRFKPEYKIYPSDATDIEMTWESADVTIATVDDNGVVLGVSPGTTEIKVKSGRQSASFTIVVYKSTYATRDYIDEYNINHGKGIKIDGTVWAPVNCGYKTPSNSDMGFPYGKLYQWGRKNGQGYSTSYDISAPTKNNNTATLEEGQSDINSNVFFQSVGDWCSQPDESMWNQGDEIIPIKTDYDPCPTGWRIPTHVELNNLMQNHSEWTTTNGGKSGYWFSGSAPYSEEAAQVFLPAAGYRNYDGDPKDRNYRGRYWSSKTNQHSANYPNYNSANYLMFSSSSMYMYYDYRASGYSVRCVQE